MQEWERDDPLIIERGSGSFVIDTAGRRYLDGTSSIWVLAEWNLRGMKAMKPPVSSCKSRSAAMCNAKGRRQGVCGTLPQQNST